jgi:hypothetical protein
MLTLLLAATIAGSTAQADLPERPRGGGMMMRADANGDGLITRDEHLAQAAERFDRMDADRDGRLTGEEMARIGRRMRAMRGGDTPRRPEPADQQESTPQAPR